jgi:hypothetical protein
MYILFVFTILISVNLKYQFKRNIYLLLKNN